MRSEADLCDSDFVHVGAACERTRIPRAPVPCTGEQPLARWVCKLKSRHTQGDLMAKTIPTFQVKVLMEG